MRVTFLSHSSDLLGAERALLELLEGMRSREVDCAVLLPRHGPLADQLLVRKIPFAVIPFKPWSDTRFGWKRPFRDLMTLGVLPWVIFRLRDWQPDLVLTNSITMPAGALAAWILRKPHVWFIHEFGQPDHGITFDLGIQRATRIMSRLSRVIIANSKAVEAYYSNYIQREKLRTIYQGVAMPRQTAYTEDCILREDKPLRLVIVGTIKPEKGQIDAVKAAAELKKRGISVVLTLVGSGEPAYLKDLRTTISNLHIEDRTQFTGFVDNPDSIVQASDVLLMCSRSEAFGRVTVEAMKIGKPVIGASSGATPELVKEGFNGVLYAPEDPVDLAEKIMFMAINRESARRMGHNGQQWAIERFSVERYTNDVLKVLRQVLQPQGED